LIEEPKGEENMPLTREMVNITDSKSSKSRQERSPLRATPHRHISLEDYCLASPVKNQSLLDQLLESKTKLASEICSVAESLAQGNPEQFYKAETAS
jgi:hypothetical protein